MFMISCGDIKEDICNKLQLQNCTVARAPNRQAHKEWKTINFKTKATDHRNFVELLWNYSYN